MEQFSAPVLIFGDIFISKNSIASIKKKYPDVKHEVMSFDDPKISLDIIRTEVGMECWDDSKKIIFIKDIPNTKKEKEFLLDIASSCLESIKIVIWDSKKYIAIDPKKKTINSKWSSFVNSFRNIKNSKVINNGGDFIENKPDTYINFIRKNFKKRGKEISDDNAKFLTQIVGLDRGLLLSDIQKLCLISPNIVTREFILENAFPTSREAVMHKLTNEINTGSYENSINIMERFLQSGTHPNLLADIFLRKARWQLVISYFWYRGMSWNDMPKALMSMGKFPSSIWHSNNSKKESDSYQTLEGMQKYLITKKGIPSEFFKKIETKRKTSKKSKGDKIIKGGKAERIPLEFIAEQEVNFLKQKVIGNKPFDDPLIKKKLIKRCMVVYLFASEKLAEIRYGNNPIQDLQEMVKALTNINLNRF